MKTTHRFLLLILAGIAGTSSVQAQSAVALTSTGRLLAFDPSTPASATTTVQITGLAGGESLVGMDYRPVNRTLVGVTNQNRLVTLNPSTGVATPLATLSVPLAGTAFGVDFNPVPDRLRIVSNMGQDLRVNVDTGAVTVDGQLAYAAADVNFNQVPLVAAAAYTNSVAGRNATTTTLYDIDYGRDILVSQNPPNAGTLVTIGALGVDFSALAALDIFSPATAYATNVNVGTSSLYRINLATGAATLVGNFSSGIEVLDFAITPKESAQGIINTAARGLVAPGEGAVIAGFVIGGTSPVNVLVSTRGPTLAQFGVVSALADTKVSLYRNSTLVDENDDWGAHLRAADITASGFGPMNAKEGALIASLAPGAYTAVVTGVGAATTGVVLVEVYELP